MTRSIRAKEVKAWAAFNFATPIAIGVTKFGCRATLEYEFGQARTADGLKTGWLTIERVRITPLKPKPARRKK